MFSVGSNVPIRMPISQTGRKRLANLGRRTRNWMDAHVDTDIDAGVSYAITNNTFF